MSQNRPDNTRHCSPNFFLHIKGERVLKHSPKVFKDFAPKKSNLTYVFLKSPEAKVGPHVSKTSVGLGGDIRGAGVGHSGPIQGVRSA